MQRSAQPIGELLSEWRRRRRLSQLDLAFEAEVSARHISFVETGRAQPSRGMVLRLAERLGVPLRERNTLLVAAGYAPTFSERPLTDPALEAARRAVDLVLSGHEPYPALAVDGGWNLVASNRALAPLLEGVDPALLQPPVNVLRLGLHPDGLAPRIANLTQWRSHLLARLGRQIEAAADPVLVTLRDELSRYPFPRKDTGTSTVAEDGAGVFVPLQIVTRSGLLTLFSTTTVFGTTTEVTLAELVLEALYPADAASAALLRRMMEGEI